MTRPIRLKWFISPDWMASVATADVTPWLGVSVGIKRGRWWWQVTARGGAPIGGGHGGQTLDDAQIAAEACAEQLLRDALAQVGEKL
jgi:hypothetical protein